MLTAVYLEGPMGKALGREWHLAVNSPREALDLIEANGAKARAWIRANLEKYSYYRVVCEFSDGRREELSEEEYKVLEMRPTVIRFVPLVVGAGAVGRIIAGIILIVASYFAGPAGPALFSMGVSLIIGGVIELLTPRPHKDDNKDQSERKDKTSYYFDGPVNTTGQGIPVPLIYGRVRCGSHVVSAAIRIDQLMGSASGPSAGVSITRVDHVPVFDSSLYGGGGGGAGGGD